MDKYLNFCKKCIEGKVGYNSNFYELNPKNSETDRVNDKPVEVTLVTPTEATVEQAKSEIKLKKAINSMAGTHKGQSGERLERVRSQRNPQEKFLARIKIKFRKVRALGEHHQLARRGGGGGVKTKKKKTNLHSLWM